MSDHAAPAEHGHAAPVLADGLRFEKSELEDFITEDRDTGANIGKMLALIFCVLLVLMTGVAWWTSSREFASQDPYDVPATVQHAAGH